MGSETHVLVIDDADVKVLRERMFGGRRDDFGDGGSERMWKRELSAIADRATLLAIPMTREKFLSEMEKAKRVVDSLPRWKREALRLADAAEAQESHE